MGRRIKNLELVSRSYAIRLPVGDNIVAPQYPVEAQIRFNTSTANMEVYYNSAWHGVGLVGRVAIVKDAFVGDGSNPTFAMSNSYAAGHDAEVIAFIDGIFQNPGIAYTINGYDITFTSPPNLNVSIVILHNFNSTNVQ